MEDRNNSAPRPINIILHCPKCGKQRPDELPGMWEESDLQGGETDCHPLSVANELHLLRQKALAFDEWLQKTDWVQEQISSFPPNSLGRHRADVMREEIERLRAARPSPVTDDDVRMLLSVACYMRRKDDSPRCAADLDKLAEKLSRAQQAQPVINNILSWGGKNVYGDKESIDAVKTALHEAGTVSALRERIALLSQSAAPSGQPAA